MKPTAEELRRLTNKELIETADIIGRILNDRSNTILDEDWAYLTSVSKVFFDLVTDHYALKL